MDHLRRWRAYLTAPVDAASLAVFRVLFGAIMLWEVLRYFAYGRVARYYIEPRYYFSYLPFIKPWGGDGMYVHFAALGVLAILITLGLAYRAAAAVFCAAFTYVFLLDKTQYLNHLYLVCLVSFLLALLPTHRAFSLDRRLFFPSAPETVPRYSLFILRAQIALVYFFGGIAKLNRDWLRGEPIGSWLADASDHVPLIGPLLAHSAAGLVFAYGGLLLDLSLGFLLVFRRTFVIGAVLAVIFNLTNALVFNIGIFPYFMIGALSLFPDPSWPRRLWARVAEPEEEALPAAPAPVEPEEEALPAAPALAEPEEEALPAAPALAEPEEEALPAAPALVEVEAAPARGIAARLRRAGEPVLFAFLHVYMLIQLALPLRHWLYPGDVNWTEDGHRFSWRMKLRDKDVRSFKMHIIDPQTGARETIDPEEWMMERQVSKMVTRPDMIIQFAHHVAAWHKAATGVRPIVRAKVIASLNGGPERDLIDPAMDLASQPNGPLD